MNLGLAITGSSCHRLAAAPAFRGVAFFHVSRCSRSRRFRARDAGHSKGGSQPPLRQTAYPNSPFVDVDRYLKLCLHPPWAVELGP